MRVLTVVELKNAPSDKTLVFSAPSLSLAQRCVTQTDVEYVLNKLLSGDVVARIVAVLEEGAAEIECIIITYLPVQF